MKKAVIIGLFVVLGTAFTNTVYKVQLAETVPITSIAPIHNVAETVPITSDIASYKL